MLEKLKNSLNGESMFIIGSAPSVKNIALGELNSKNSFGVNSSPILESEYGFCSNYYAVSDTRFINNSENIEIIRRKMNNSNVFLREEVANELGKDFDNCIPVKSLGKYGFSENFEEGFFFGGSTVLLALQASYYLGVKKIFLLGVDLSYYFLEQKRFLEEAKPQPHDPHISHVLYCISQAGTLLKEKEVDLINCSESSMLFPYLPFMSFEEALKF